MEKITLTENWRFLYGDCPEAWYAGFDDSAWRCVCIPHDLAVEAPFSESFSSGTGYLRGGTAWYRLRFRLDDRCKGRTVRILFDGIYKNSQVWCNSMYLGRRPSGYAPFFYDITHCVRFGETDNTLCVRVAHEDISDSRWYTGTGITRPVSLLIEEPVHPAVGGIFFSAQVNEDLIEHAQDSRDARSGACEQPLFASHADLRLKLRLQNSSDAVRSADVQAALIPIPDALEADSHAASSADGTVRITSPRLTIPAHGEIDAACTGRIAPVRLWSPQHPQRYRLVIRLISEAASADNAADPSAGRTEDTYEIPVGIRAIRFDPDHGFYLNGVNMKLKGVCVHEDAGCLGAAVPSEVWERRLELLKDCGVNAIRMSHNPHAEALYELCDRLGFLVMDEAFDEWENPKNKWWHGHNVYPPRHQGSFEDFPAWHDADLRAMVRRGRNHPSIILWSVGNEIDYPNDPYVHPMFAEMTGNNDANKPAAERAYDADKPSMERLAAIAPGLAAIVREEDDTREVTIAAAFPELSAGIGFIDAFRVVGYNYKEMLYEKDHARFPDKVFLGSENGHEAAVWQVVLDHDYICGQFLWTGIDYLGEAKGWPVHGSPAGLLTTAGFPKERYDARKALWTEADGHPGEKTDDRVGCESTCADASSDHPRITIACWRPRRAAAGQAEADLWEKRRNENGFIEQYLLRLTDEAGHILRDSDRMITVHITGPGELAGLDNGDLADNTPFSASARRTLRGELAVYVRRTGPGEITLRAE